MSSVKWIQGAVISLSLLLGACGGGGGDDFDNGDSGSSDPVAAITNPTEGSVHPENSDISFTGTGLDDEDGTLGGASLEWSSDTDGPLDTGTTVSATLSTGSHTITLKVTDSDGAMDTDTITIMVNAAPAVDTLVATPASVNVGTPTTISWTITDAESDTLTCGLDLNGDGTDEHTINDCANGSQAHTYAQAGDYQVRLTVRDGVNTAVQQSVNVTVADGGTVNALPQIGSFNASPDAPKTGDVVTFSWTVNDADGDTLTCGLDLNGDGTDEHTINDCANGSQAHIYMQAGDYQVRLTVTDNVNAPVQQSLNVMITDPDTSNASPEINSFDAAPDAPTTSNSMTFDWTVSDADDDTLTCKLDVDEDGTDDYTISDCANNTSQAHIYTQAGTYQVRLTVEDGTNSPVLMEIDLTVSSAPPVISEFTVNPDPAYSTVATTFYWQVSDPEGDALTCLLDINNDGTDDYTIDDCTNMASQEHAYASSGDYTARLTVRDSVNETQTIVSLTVKPHLLLDVTVGGPVSADGRALYTMTVSNVSTRPVDDVSMVFTVPPELSFHYTTDAEPNASICGNGVCTDGEEASWALATLAAGESRTITVNASVLAGVLSGTLVNTSIRVTTTDENVIDNVTVNKVVAVNNDPMSQLAISASKDPVMPNDSLTLTFDVGNIDNAALDNLELRAMLPAGVTVVNISDGGSQDATTGDVIWEVTSLAVGNTLRRNVDVTVDDSVIAGQILATRAELRHDDGVDLDASAEYAVTVVTDTFPLLIDISATPDPVVADGHLLYDITVSNTSAVPVNEVTVLLRVPPELSFHYTTDAEPNASICGNGVCTDGEEASWALATLAAGESRTITVNASVLAGVLSGTLVNTSIRVTATDENVIDNVNRITTTAVSN